MIDSRCGLHCNGCQWKESHGCGGCIETMGNPFHGECHIARCCQGKGHTHCGECEIIPCSNLYRYSYLDREHGDNPEGERVKVCRSRVMEGGKKIYQKILLTSAGFEDMKGEGKPNITDCFLRLLEKAAEEAKVLFIPAAAIDEEELKMADWCYRELLHIGILPENIQTYYLEYEITTEEAMSYDVIYFTGGNTRHLLKVLKSSGFFSIVKKLAYRNKLFVGVSAGSLIATPNIAHSKEEETEGLCLIQAYLSVHCTADSSQRKDLPLPHICLKDNQAILVTGNEYQIIED